jgi:hypothetical protein
LRAIQQDIVIILNLIEIDFESLFIKLKNNKFTTGSEIRKILHLNENIRKLLNEKQYLISRLYTAISAQKENIYGNFSILITDLIWQLQNKNVYSIAKIEMLRNSIA